MKMAKYILLWIIAIVPANADLSDFVRDNNEFRHGTYDRISKPKTVYVDKDGSLLFPVSDKLQAVGREWLGKILEMYPDDRRQGLELRVYIHPEAPWTKIHDLVTWLTKQNIGLLDLKIASMQASNAADAEEEIKKPNKSEMATPRKPSD